MRKIIKFFLMMALMTPTLSVAQSATNSVYIDQVGDSSTITLTQSGQNNSIGTENARFQIQGGNQNITVLQNGTGNSIQGSIKQADNVNYSINMIGDSNTLDIDHGSAGSVSGSALTLNATGSVNTFTLTQGDAASSSGAVQTINLTGDRNTYTSKINADDVIQTTTVTGDSNTLDLLQNGRAAKNLDFTLTGSNNNFTVKQTSTLNVDRLSINSQSSGTTMLIKQCNSGC
jgi:hypothetical protein